MPAIAGGVNQHIRRCCGDRAIEDGLERLVAGLAFFKAEVIAKHDELFWQAGHYIDDVRQIGQVGFVNLNQPQTPLRIFIQTGLDQ